MLFCLQEYLRRFNPDVHVTAIDFFLHWTDHEQAEARLPLTYDAPATTANYTVRAQSFRGRPSLFVL